MSPERKLNSVIVGFTVGLMLIVISLLPSTISPKNTIDIIVGFCLASLTSTGIYVFLVKIISFVILKWAYVKRMLLGTFYMEGTWIGFLEEQDNPLFAVLYFEQDLDTSSIVMRGTNYYQNGEINAIWNSESLAINPILGHLIYSYSCRIVSTGSTTHGCGILNLQRESKDKPPSEIKGVALDYGGDVRTVKEIKISNKILEEKAAFNMAIDYYKNHYKKNS